MVKDKVILTIIRIIAVLLAAYSLCLVFMSNFNMGNLLVWLLTGAVGLLGTGIDPSIAGFQAEPDEL